MEKTPAAGSVQLAVLHPACHSREEEREDSLVLAPVAVAAAPE